MNTNAEFLDWLREKINRLGLTYDELSARSGISKSYISLVLSGDRSATRNFCAKIARGLGIDEDLVLVKAGLKTSSSKLMDEKTAALVDLFEQLSDKGKEKAISYLKFLNKEPG